MKSPGLTAVEQKEGRCLQSKNSRNNSSRMQAQNETEKAARRYSGPGRTTGSRSTKVERMHQQL
jgi:hypothetical protein